MSSASHPSRGRNTKSGKNGLERERLSRQSYGIIVISGHGQLLQWREIAATMGIEIRYESKVDGFHGNEHRIEGVRSLMLSRRYGSSPLALVSVAGLLANAQNR